MRRILALRAEVRPNTIRHIVATYPDRQSEGLAVINDMLDREHRLCARSWGIAILSHPDVETLISEADGDQIPTAADARVRIVSNTAASGNLPRQLERRGEMAGAGEVKASITATVPLAEVAEAHRCVQDGHVRGKIAIENSRQAGH